MVDVNELRIGNWFIGYDNKPFQWELEHFKMLSTVDVDEIIKSPIPLTEDILLKCGFEKKSMYDVEKYRIEVWFLEDIGYLSPNFEYCINASNDHSEYDNITALSTPMNSLHQLQNLYFSLTGKELEVKI